MTADTPREQKLKVSGTTPPDSPPPHHFPWQVIWPGGVPNSKNHLHLATRALGSTCDLDHKSQPPLKEPLPQRGLSNEAGGWNRKRKVRALYLFKETALRGRRGPGRKKGSCSFSTLPPSPPPSPNTQVPDSFLKKTSLQTHSDFWEAAQFHSLSLLPLPRQGADSLAGPRDCGRRRGWWARVGVGQKLARSGPDPAPSQPDSKTSAAATVAGLHLPDAPPPPTSESSGEVGGRGCAWTPEGPPPFS